MSPQDVPPGLDGPEHDQPSSLNERDLELLRHVADGMSTRRISAVMSVTTNTTRTRMRRVQRKLAVLRPPTGGAAAGIAGRAALGVL